MKKRIWLSPPHMGRKELSFVQEAFDTNWIAPLGPNVDAFEKELSLLFNGNSVAVVNSGTAALHLALNLLNVSNGDEVICQTFTFAASANPVVYLGATPVFVDSEPDTWNMDPDLLEKAIQDRLSLGKNIKAVVVVNLYGMPAKMEKILAVASKYAIPVIEDAAESLGSSINNIPCGTFGSLGVISFNGNKIITTSSGGALISNNEDFILSAKHLATQAKDPGPFYQHSKIGYNYKMSNVLAGIGLGQLSVLNERIAARRDNYNRYFNYFSAWNQKGFNIEFQLEPSGFFSNRWLTCILIDPATNKGITIESIRLLFEQYQIEVRSLWKPMHLQPVFVGTPRYLNGVSDRLFDIGLCLPSGSSLTDDDFDRIFEYFDMVFSKS
jgi:dTDP-4-amino-4,6-dideoxygalactose transaminase